MPSPAQRLMYIFPGQGAQYKGMGSDLYQDYAVAKRIYDKANTVLGYDLAELSFAGPEARLNLTRFTQPALLTHSIACWEAFKELTGDRLTVAIVAGHSLGEYSALVAAGALTFETALQLVQHRGECMGTYGEGEMLALPLGLADAGPLAEKHYCGVAACNLQEQTVVGGNMEDLARLAQEFGERFPRKRSVHLKTEGAFHTYFMVQAARHFRPTLEAITLATPAIAVSCNYTGAYHEPDPALIKSRLFYQLFHTVQWMTNLDTAIRDGVTHIIEFGGGIGSGITPADKRPNLENIIKKTLHMAEHQAQYFPVINSRSLIETAKAVHG
jgi:[acyl-carrier-protein] S-malonyltransferase